MINSQDIVFPIAHPSFKGHFPGNPIVAGALLLSIVIQEVKKHYRDISITGVNTSKFITVVSPGDKCLCISHLDTHSKRLKIELKKQDITAFTATLNISPLSIESC